MILFCDCEFSRIFELESKINHISTNIRPIQLVRNKIFFSKLLLILKQIFLKIHKKMADTTLSQLRDDKNHINDINQILFENLNSAAETKKQKKQKKLDFFENIVKNTIRSNVHFNRSNMFLVKNKFHKSTNYNRYRKTYVDKLRKYQRSKSLECRNDSKVLKLDDGKISFINSCCCFFF